MKTPVIQLTKIISEEVHSRDEVTLAMSYALGLHLGAHFEMMDRVPQLTIDVLQKQMGSVVLHTLSQVNEEIIIDIQTAFDTARHLYVYRYHATYPAVNTSSYNEQANDILGKFMIPVGAVGLSNMAKDHLDKVNSFIETNAELFKTVRPLILKLVNQTQASDV